MTVDNQYTDLLARCGARDRVAERDRFRLIIAANKQGLTHRAISDGLGTVSQATVTRLLQRAESDPDLSRETPAEVIDRCAAGEIDSDEMMDRLMNWHYTFGYLPTVNGNETDAYVTGDWNQVERAYYRGLLNDEQFQTLADRQNQILERLSQPR
ncbi:winged helix-turn-helix domain-containing protein (plasmid) [Rhodococcus globerulus]|uniref:winged helix-turn-helix domain-containing protein n=1 Tax=Rhodococcus globerulus TaxID=33008 RepID=UPI0039E97DF1